MTEPASMKNEPFTDFPRQSYSLIGDDFCHDKAFVAKATAKTAKSVIKLKEAVSYKNDSYSVADEIKLFFDLPKSASLYCKVKSSDYIKLSYDNGIKEWNQKKLYWFGGLNSSKKLKNIVLKAGCGHISEHCTSENRIRVALQQEQANWQWANRTVATHNKFTFGLVAVLDITNRVLQKNNFLLGYKADANTNLFLRAETAGFRKQNINLEKPEGIVDTITADIIRTLNDKNKAGLEATFDLRSKEVSSIQAVFQSNYRAKEMAKIAINNNFDISVVHKRPLIGLESMGTLSVGANVSGLNGKKLEFKHGFEVALNL